MVKQVIVMNLQDKCFGPNLETIKSNMKNRLEALNGQIDGMRSLEVYADCLTTSNADIFVEIVFEDEEALKNLKSNDEYNAATKDVVVPFVDNRTHIEFALC
ncbi:Dabb family protein [Pseudobutyrivibrio xylanivorans]|uniref:Stress responsive A/B Barrel Domain n=1 Tax=Pseudobutyrivibrio xylanivorans TaxID=185007 RepID=A0A1G5S5V4_PSEXY|nr:Dabb family protein [Pseudobutyrivibrio xylanivorans]SCZ81578.1 Stress responsive A/B Barrel Domain [Pseudobutyrivibrio xylanivorans]